MMNLNEWLMKFIVLDTKEAEAAAVAISAIIRRDEEALRRLYEKSGGRRKAQC